MYHLELLEGQSRAVEESWSNFFQWYRFSPVRVQISRELIRLITLIGLNKFLTNMISPKTLKNNFTDDFSMMDHKKMLIFGVSKDFISNFTYYTWWLLVNNEKSWCAKNVNEGRRFLILFLVTKLKGCFFQLLQTAKTQSHIFWAVTDCKKFNSCFFEHFIANKRFTLIFWAFLIFQKAESTFLSFFILQKIKLMCFRLF